MPRGRICLTAQWKVPNFVAMDPAIEIDGVGRDFAVSKGATVRALDDVSFNVGAGEVVALLGANGAGKTTLTKILATLLLPTRGTARVMGHDVVDAVKAVRGCAGVILGGDKGLDLTLERTLEQDISFGLRMLVDMGIKAISESPLADPTTTVQALDRVHDVLRQLARRELPEGAERDADGVVRLVVPSMDWHAFVRHGFEELRLAGSASPQVARRLQAALDDLLEWAPQDRQEPLQEQLDLLQEAVERTVDEPRNRRPAHQPDAQGIGIAAGDSTAEVPSPTAR